MRPIIASILATIAAILLLSCNNKLDKEMHLRFAKWDTQLEKHAQAISDSLKTINPHILSRKNRAYYNLLKIISDDKTYFDFTTDSLINQVVDYYHSHEPAGDNYIRALIYKGVVRTRMGITDSTVYEPLKKADKIFHRQKNPDPKIGYILHYFLGNTHYYNRSFKLAGIYFQKTLHNAKLKQDSIHIFDAYLSLYWNEMAQSNLEIGKNYLDTLLSYYNIIKEKNYHILNAQSVYFEEIGEYEKALMCEKKQLSILESQKDDIDISSLYFVISDRYNKINKLDSAMYYGVLAIANIVDESKKENYLFYENVANIAEKQKNYHTANTYKKKKSI